MERVRLTNRVIAAMEKDVYNMNVPEKKDPGQSYQKPGDNPSGWAEDPAKKDWDGQKRDEMNVAVPGSGVNKNAAAIKSARKLEEKAIKCIVAAQRMLPGATDVLIEAQAADLMHLPEIAIANTLVRQEDLAKSFTKEAADAAKEEEKEEEKKEEPKEAEAAKKEEEEVEEEKEASLEEVVASLKKQASTIQAALTKIQAGEMPEGFKKFIKRKKDEKKEEVEAKKEEKDEMEAEAAKKPAKEDEEMEAEAAKKEDKEDMETEAAKKEDKEEEMEAEAAKKDEKEEMEMDEKEASAPSLLDTIFESVTGTSKKVGAKSLSGLVKKASNGEDNLSSLWDAPPDVSKNF